MLAIKSASPPGRNLRIASFPNHQLGVGSFRLLILILLAADPGLLLLSYKLFGEAY